MNRKNEFEALIRSTLVSLGCNKQLTDSQLKTKDRRSDSLTDNIPDYELQLLTKFFYAVVQRLIKPKPRQFVKYDGFDYKGNDLGVENIKNKVSSGVALTPHLSKLVFNVDQSGKNDPMLNEWQIYHFHIPENDGARAFVTRSQDLLFAIVTEEHFICLDIQPHSDSTGCYEPWVDVDIISKIEYHYPDMLKDYFVGSNRTPLTAEQRKSIRDRNGNTSIITNSGNEYRTLGSGSVAAGYSVNVIQQSDMALNFVRQLDTHDHNGVLKLDANFNPSL